MIYSIYSIHDIETPDILVETSGNRFERIKIIFQKFIDFIDKLYKNLKYNIFLKGSHYKKYKSFIDHGFEQIYTAKNIKCKIDSLDFGKVKEYLMSTESYINYGTGMSKFVEENTIAIKDFNINEFIVDYCPKNVDDLLSFTTTGYTREILKYFDNLKINCRRLLSSIDDSSELVFFEDREKSLYVNIRNMVQNTINACTKCYKFIISQVKIANSICDDCIKVAKDELKKNDKWELTYGDDTTTESVNLGVFEGVKFI